MTIAEVDAISWQESQIKEDQITKYLDQGNDFIPDAQIFEKIRAQQTTDPVKIRDILAKSLAIQTLTPDETAALLHVTDRDLIEEMRATAFAVKKKVYDNRIVTFAPLYVGNLCVNNCLYCGFRRDNKNIKRGVLTLNEVKKEVDILAGKIGHKRLIVVFGEHPQTDVDYMVKTIEAIYSVKIKTQKGWANIRRVNVNAAPLSIEDLKKLKAAGIGTYQVFQETYHRETYARLHPKGTLKGHFRWRLYCMHRAMEAGIDDVGIGALFGLSDWKFEVMGLVYHAWALEKALGIGPHTVSFPRLEPAFNTPFAEYSRYKVSDEDFKRILLVIRLAIPYTGMILTARENPEIRDEFIHLGLTQMDASTKIGIGAYSAGHENQEEDRQQFILGDTRSLEEVIRGLALKGSITSFCTAGYRCGRTGKCIMDLLRSGNEGKFCKLNAVLTYREWIDDFADDATRKAAEPVIQKEISEIREKMPRVFPKFMETYERIKKGERDIYF